MVDVNGLKRRHRQRLDAGRLGEQDTAGWRTDDRCATADRGIDNSRQLTVAQRREIGRVAAVGVECRDHLARAVEHLDHRSVAQRCGLLDHFIRPILQLGADFPRQHKPRSALFVGGNDAVGRVELHLHVRVAGRSYRCGGLRAPLHNGVAAQGGLGIAFQHGDRSAYGHACNAAAANGGGCSQFLSPVGSVNHYIAVSLHQTVAHQRPHVGARHIDREAQADTGHATTAN